MNTEIGYCDFEYGTRWSATTISLNFSSEMSFLLNNQLYKLIHFSVETGYFLRVTPFRWDKKQKILYFAKGYFEGLGVSKKSKFRIGGWDIVKYLYFLHQLFLLSGFFRFNAHTKDVFHHYSTQTLAFVSFSLICAAQLSIMLLNHDLLHIINQALVFSQKVQGKRRLIDSIPTM